MIPGPREVVRKLSRAVWIYNSLTQSLGWITSVQTSQKCKTLISSLHPHIKTLFTNAELYTVLRFSKTDLKKHEPCFAPPHQACCTQTPQPFFPHTYSESSRALVSSAKRQRMLHKQHALCPGHCPKTGKLKTTAALANIPPSANHSVPKEEPSNVPGGLRSLATSS